MSSSPTYILIVANRTAAAPQLLTSPAPARGRAVQVRAADPDVHDRKTADWTLESALPVLQRRAGGPVEGLVGGPDPLASIQDAVDEGGYDEIIVSTLPRKTSKWLKRDLISRVERLGLPVTAITPAGNGMTNKKAAKMMLGAGGGAGGIGLGHGDLGLGLARRRPVASNAPRRRSSRRASATDAGLRGSVAAAHPSCGVVPISDVVTAAVSATIASPANTSASRARSPAAASPAPQASRTTIGM